MSKRRNHDHRKIQEPLMCADVGDICDPELVRSIHIELSILGVICHEGRAASIRAWLLFVTNLRPYARQTG